MKKRKVLVCFLIAVLSLSAFLAGCTSNEAGGRKYIKSTDELAEANIGVQTGTVFDETIKAVLPDCNVEYFNNNLDILAALDSGKIDALVSDEAFAATIIRSDKSYRILEKLNDDNYGYVFPLNSDKSEMLCSQINEFLAKAESDGTLDELKSIWLGDDEAKKDVDFDGLTGENGVLKFAVSTEGTEPLTYVKNGKVVGYEVDLTVRFCKEYGYGIEVEDFTFSGLLSAVSSGKVDFAASCISITDERKQTVLMSSPDFYGGVVVLVKNDHTVYSSFDDLQGKRAGVLTGSAFDVLTQKMIPGSEVYYFNSCADASVALNSGKIDFYVLDEPVSRYLMSENPNQRILGILQDDHYGVIFRKGDANGELLCRQMNDFLAEIRVDGTYDEIIERWLGPDAENRSVDFDNMPAENGVLTYAMSTSIGAPYAYVKDGGYAGYEIDLAVRFCRRYGYGIKLFDSDFSGMLSAVSLGKADFGSSGISITDERRESMLFSDPIYDGGIAVVVSDGITAADDKPFFESVIESIEKTFVREERWKLFLSGIGITILITVLSALFGTVIGFAFFMIYRKGNKVFVTVFDTVGAILEKMPVVVILMILYYVIFGSSDISAVIISIIGFTVLFSFGVLGLIKTGVATVDKGQTEAALALGYTDSRAFLTMVFPQAVGNIMPGFKSSLVSLVKDTSIVGYIAVQDLTKASDIVRSRTYEAFFPLIATAVIYFIIAFILIRIINRIEICTDPRTRKTDKILKGVVTK